MTGLRFRLLMFAILCLGAPILSGCGRSSKEMTSRAEAAVDKALNAWVGGDSPDKYAEGQPIQFVDPDWKSGSRLQSFLMAETTQLEEKPENPVRCRVALALKDARGQKTVKEVIYVVRLGETTIVNRE